MSKELEIRYGSKTDIAAGLKKKIVCSTYDAKQLVQMPAWAFTEVNPINYVHAHTPEALKFILTLNLKYTVGLYWFGFEIGSEEYEYIKLKYPDIRAVGQGRK